MDTALGHLATAGGAVTVTEVHRGTALSITQARAALQDLTVKGVTDTDHTRPVRYRINDLGRRMVAANPRRFGR
jgi:hypothetical protein